jgi:hypothetical protein
MDLPSPDSLFSAGSAPGLVPRVKLEKDAGAGGFGGELLSAAAGVLGLSAAQPDPLTESLGSVDIRLVAAPGLSSCSLRFLPRSDFPSLALGDALTVKLAGSGDPLPAFAGSVARVSGSGATLEVLLAAPSARLARIRRNGGFENQGFGQLLKAWAGEAGVTTGQVDDGPDYAFFAIDDRLSLWDWIARVARHADVPVWVDATGALNATRPAGRPLASFDWGRTILALEAQARDPVITAAHIVGEGSAGRQGSDAWSWLAKDPQGVSANAGAGPAGAVEQEGGLRDLASIAAAAAGAAAGAARIADRVQVRVPGTPALDVAGLFALAGCPRGEGDGTWAALAVQHHFSPRRGFVTVLQGVRP